jgi:hypothetical protein
LLQQIATGAQQCKEVEEQFGENPAPELETLIKLHRVLIMKLSTQASADPGSMMETLFFAMKPVMDFAKLQDKAKDREFAISKFQFDATKAALAKLPELNAIKRNTSLREDEKLAQARLKLFGEVPA